MRVTTNLIFNNLLNSLTNNRDKYQNIQKIISSEQKLFVPSDDPTGIRNSAIYRKDYSAYEQYGKNLDQAKNLLTATDSSFDQINLLLTKARGIAEVNASESSTTQSRSMAVDEIDEIIKQSVQEMNREVNGRYIFSGFKTSTPPYSNVGKVSKPYANVSNQWDGTLKVNGDYQGTENKNYLVKVVTPGTYGFAEYKISEDGGTTWSNKRTLTNTIHLYDEDNGEDSGLTMVFNGSGSFAVDDQFKVYVGAGKYSGDDGSIKINVGKNTTLATNISGQEAFENNDYYGILNQLKIGLDNDNTSEISDALEKLNDLQENIQKSIGKEGILLQQTSVIKNNLDSVNNDVLKRIQDIEKPDLVKAMSEFSLQQNALNSSINMMAKVFPTSLLNYI